MDRKNGINRVCRRCGGRLLLENEYQLGRLFYFMGCVSCGCEHNLAGELPKYTVENAEHGRGSRRAVVAV